jgi:hypothetical protein
MFTFTLLALAKRDYAWKLFQGQVKGDISLLLIAIATTDPDPS